MDMIRSKRTGRGRKNRRTKRRRELTIEQESSAVPSSSTESTTDTGSMHTPTERVVAVDLEKVRTRFSRLEIEGEEATNQRPMQATAVVEVSPRTREKGSLRTRVLFPTRVPILPVRTAALLPPWTPSELLALVTFILLYTDGTRWPYRRCDDVFWENAAKFVPNFSQLDHCRTGYCMYTCTVTCIQ